MADNSRPPVTSYPAPPLGASSSGCPPGPHSNTAYPHTTLRLRFSDYQYYAPNRLAAFFRCFLEVIITFLVILGTVLFIFWTHWPPLPEFRVESLTVTNFSVSSSLQHVSGDWLVQFRVANPSKMMKISYTDIQSYICYESEYLSMTWLPPFDQGTRSQTVVQASFGAVDSYVDGQAVTGINGERASGAVSFQARLIALAQFEARWWGRQRLIRVFCGDLAVALPSNNGTGKLTGGVRDCRVVVYE